MERIFIDNLVTPFINLQLIANDQGLIYIQSDQDVNQPFSTWLNNQNNMSCVFEGNIHTNEASDQLVQYFEGQRQSFQLKTSCLFGSSFQLKVWHGLEQVPYGEQWSYSQLAQSIKLDKSVRAVSHAVAKNPLLIILPCHRIIRKDKQLGGYRGGLDLKRKLLNLEGRNQS